MNVLLTTTVALGVVFTLGAIQPVNAIATAPNSSDGYDQSNIMLAHGHGGGGVHGGFGGHHGGFGHHGGWGYGGFGGGVILGDPVFIDPGYDYEYYDPYY